VGDAEPGEGGGGVEAVLRHEQRRRPAAARRRCRLVCAVQTLQSAVPAAPCMAMAPGPGASQAIVRNRSTSRSAVSPAVLPLRAQRRSIASPPARCRAGTQCRTSESRWFKLAAGRAVGSIVTIGPGPPAPAGLDYSEASCEVAAQASHLGSASHPAARSGNGSRVPT
jgi:hypothetical protein